MSCRVMLVLLLLTLLGGCKAIVRDAETVEYQPGATPTTVVAKCDASYKLEVRDDAHKCYPPTDVTKGAVVGFRREPDGSLTAIAGKETKAIPEGRYVWGYKPKPVTQWERLAVGTRDTCSTAAGWVCFALFVPLDLCWCALSGEAFP